MILSELAIIINKELKWNLYDNGKRYCVCFEGVRVRDNEDSSIVGTPTGQASSRYDALVAYAAELGGKWIVTHTHNAKPLEFRLPPIIEAPKEGTE